jgi:sterol desaturase/sphingolipid hydroxylase (fatty acid hydroxylase superfamily)
MHEGLAHKAPWTRLRQALTWPALLVFGLAGTGIGMAAGHPLAGFNASYLVVAISLWALERRWPHEPRWLDDDGQMLPDLLHTLLTKGLVQAMAMFSVVLGLAGDAVAASWWPASWPMLLQVVLALLLAELGLYWSHRLAHEWPLLWRFHAVHHSVERLWFWNTGRFHAVDTLQRVVFAVPLLWLAGAPADVLQWVSAVTAFIGILTHANIDVRCGPLSRVFNTPELHRWHHSRRPEEGHRNCGENLVAWDLLFGTWYLPDRCPPRDIGIDAAMPPGFVGQLLAPFRRQSPPR